MRNDTSILASIQNLLGEDFNLSLFISIIKKSIVWFFVLIALAVLFVILYLRYTLPVYEAEASLMLKTEKKAEILGIKDVLSYQTDDVKREIEIMKSKYLIGRAIDNLPLKVSYFKEGRTKLVSTELYNSSPFWVDVKAVNDQKLYNTDISIRIIDSKKFNLRYITGTSQVDETLTFGEYFESGNGALELKVMLNLNGPKSQQNLSGDFFFRINEKATYVEQIIPRITIAPLNPATKTISINYKDNNQIKARDIVNAITLEFQEYNIERKTEGADQILEFLEYQIDTFSVELSALQDSLKKFRMENLYLNPSDEMTSLSNRLGELEDKRMQVVGTEQIVNWFYDYIEGLKDIKVLSEGLGTEMGDYSKYIEELRELEEEKRTLLQKVSPDHPNVILINQKIEQVQNDLTNNLENILKRLEFSKETINEEYAKYLNQILSLPEKEAEYLRLDRKYQMKEEFYLNLLDKQAEFSIARAGIVGDYIVLQDAEVTEAPISPDKNALWLVSIAIAVVLSVVIIVVRYMLHNTIISLDDISRHTKASILGMVPTVYNNIPLSSIVVSNNPKSIVSEALRSLRSNLQFISSGEGPKVLAITSTISGEGKTFLAINFGAILSFLNKKVIILDVDMRRPRLSKIFNVSNDKGMSTILIDKDNYKDCIHTTELENLQFITSGPIPPNPAELILSDKLQEVLALMKEEYDYIIFDTPPLGLVTDGLEIIKQADYPVYVFRADYSSKSFISNLDKLIEDNKVTQLSVVLNDVGRGVSGYYYGYGGYGYSYGYGYGFGYYSDETKPQRSFLQRLFGRS